VTDPTNSRPRRRWRRFWLCAIAVGVLSVWLGVRFVALSLSASQAGAVPVLMYHKVSPDEDDRGRYVLPVQEFDRQLEYLAEEGYESILPEDLLASQRGDSLLPERAVMITFDDGTKDHYEFALPVLERHGFRGVFFVISGTVGKEGYLSQEELLDMADRGMSIQSHSHSHALLDQLDVKELRDYLTESKRLLSELTGESVGFLCFPGGWYDEQVVRLAKESGYCAAYSSNVGVNSPGKFEYVVRRIEVRGDAGLDEFTRLTSISTLFRRQIERDIKVATHRLLGSSRYQSISRSRSRRAYLLCGGCAVLLLIVGGGVVVYLRGRHRGMTTE
jgi:peptidoglycan/xylan/chitin deacetylase (PgdA/CDA1 family)